MVEFQQEATISSSAEESRIPSADAGVNGPAAKSWLTAPVGEIDVLWITAGLGCDGDTISITAATQPSIEELMLGALPGVPKVRLHNPFLDYKNGDDFLENFHRAAEGKLERFILVIEGSIPDETNKPEGYWAGFGT